MKPAFSVTAILVLLAAALAWAQRERVAPPPKEVTTWEYRALIPQEVAPGEYRQVDWYLVTSMGDQGWEMVGVTSWVIHNDERKVKSTDLPRVVTQNYMAYYFKRPRTMQR